MLAVVVALVLVMAPAALAANGKPFLLGKRNVATAVSTLIKKGPGPALSLKVRAGQPPLAVNSAGKVANLNADLLDGQDSSAFLGANGKAADADRLDGLDSSAYVQSNTNAFLRNSIYQRESVVSTGTLLGDGTRKIIVSCFPGDVVLSGGPANIDAGTILLESFPKDNTWNARIQNDGTLDAFSVVALCANQ